MWLVEQLGVAGETELGMAGGTELGVACGTELHALWLGACMWLVG